MNMPMIASVPNVIGKHRDEQEDPHRAVAVDDQLMDGPRDVEVSDLGRERGMRLGLPTGRDLLAGQLDLRESGVDRGVVGDVKVEAVDRAGDDRRWLGLRLGRVHRVRSWVFARP